MTATRLPTTTSIALIAVFAALVAASTLAPEIALGPVPLSLQTFAIVVCGLVLGAWRGAVAVGLYVAVGLAGAPIFSNGRGGFAVLVGPTGGYLIGMIAAAFVVGLLTQMIRRSGRLTFWRLLGPAVVSIPVVYAIGVPYLSWRTGLPLALPPAGCSGEECVTAVSAGVLPFIVGDLIKVVAAAGVAALIHRAYPMVMPAPRADVEAPTTA